MGQILAKEKATLYLNLEDCPGFEDFIPYGIRPEHFRYHLLPAPGRDEPHFQNSCRGRSRREAGFPSASARSPQELRGVTAEEWHRLFTAIRENSSYEILILDIGSGPDCLGDLLGNAIIFTCL